jgi:hypothetical protein
MKCVEIKTKKYQTRKGPPYHAKDCKGSVKKGNDGIDYVSKPNKKGIYTWLPKNKVRHKTLKKSGVKTYNIIDNGSKPFVVDVYPSHIEIYKQILKNIDGKEQYERDRKIKDTTYKKIFIGDNNLKITEGVAPKGMYPGNSILVQINNEEYIYIGHEIYSFNIHEGDKILRYYSPVGNSAVPYPYAIGEKYTYFMLDRQTVPNDILDLKKNGYEQFYGFKIMNEELRTKIETSKKNFKTKLIHKRHLF